MCMCVCVDTCVHVCVCACVCLWCTCVCLCACVRACGRACVRALVCMGMHVCARFARVLPARLTRPNFENWSSRSAAVVVTVLKLTTKSVALGFLRAASRRCSSFLRGE